MLHSNAFSVKRYSSPYFDSSDLYHVRMYVHDVTKRIYNWTSQQAGIHNWLWRRSRLICHQMKERQWPAIVFAQRNEWYLCLLWGIKVCKIGNLKKRKERKQTEEEERRKRLEHPSKKRPHKVRVCIDIIRRDSSAKFTWSLEINASKMQNVKNANFWAIWGLSSEVALKSQVWTIPDLQI